MSPAILIRRILLLVFGCGLLADSVLLVVARGSAAQAPVAQVTYVHVKATVDSKAAADKIASRADIQRDQVRIHETNGMHRVPDGGYSLKYPGKTLDDMKPVRATLQSKGYAGHVETEDDGSPSLFLDRVFPSSTAAAAYATRVRSQTPIQLEVCPHSARRECKLWVVEFVVPDQTTAESLRSDLSKLKKQGTVLQVR